jgi:hypothetical protein
MAGIVVMCQPLAVVSVKFIETLVVGVTFGTGISEAPFAKCTGNVTSFL